MALNDTVKNLKNLLAHITHDLDKAEKGNKAASQRVRTGTVKLEKIAKLYRKESIKTEKNTKGGKKPAKKAAKPAPKQAAKKAAAKPAAKPAKKPAKPAKLQAKKPAKLQARRPAR